MGHHDVRVEISADRPEIGRIIRPDPRKTSKLFPKNFGSVCSSSFRRTPKNRIFAPWAQNHSRGQSVAFVAFVAFWGTTMLFFKKFKISAFRKVYGLWGYFQPLKGYITLKFRWGTVSHLWMGVSHDRKIHRWTRLDALKFKAPYIFLCWRKPQQCIYIEKKLRSWRFWKI